MKCLFCRATEIWEKIDLHKAFKYFNICELLVWFVGSAAVVVCFFVFGNREYHYMIGALIGIASLMFASKGNPVGQILIVVLACFTE